MGDQGWDHCAALGEALAPLLDDPGVIVVASTDLSHFHTAEKATGLDGEFCEHLAALDVEGLSEAVDKRKCEACGAGPVIAALIATNAAADRACTILKRANSGDVTGDFDNVVGYMSAAITASV
jgi:AmmeMemoRadiSam system protein B